MRTKRVVPAALIAAALLAPAAARASVRILVVGPQRVLSGPRTVSDGAARVRASGRPCRVAGGTALAALAGLSRARGPGLAVRDYGAGACDPLFVTRIGRFANRGQGGWTYKVGNRAGTTAANDPAGPFGTGRRIRPGAQVLWFYCRAGGDCQRTLGVSADRGRVAHGATLHVRVRGYDDRGRGVPVAGARVTLGPASAPTGRNGIATLRAPARAGTFALSATKRGLSPGFPGHVTVR